MTMAISSHASVKRVIRVDFVKFHLLVQPQPHCHHQPMTNVSQILALIMDFAYQTMDVLLVAFVHPISAGFIAKIIIVRNWKNELNISRVRKKTTTRK